MASYTFRIGSTVSDPNDFSKPNKYDSHTIFNEVIQFMTAIERDGERDATGCRVKFNKYAPG